MNINIRQRRAIIADLPEILHLLIDDELGEKRELNTLQEDCSYLMAFEKISSDPSHYLMVVLAENKIIGTCHLTILPSLTYQGSTRLQVEAVRVARSYRGQKIGEWMMKQAFAYAREQGANIVQLTTNKERIQAKRFYEKLGFKASHEGMKCFLDGAE